MSASIGRILFFPRETFPTDRVRLNTLFGRELMGRGHAIDLIMQAKDPTTRPGRMDWSGRSVWIGKSGSGANLVGRIEHLAHGISHDVKHLLLLAQPEKYDCVLVSDKYVLGALACVVAKARRMRFIFWLTFPYHEADFVLSKERAPPFSAFLALRGRVTTLLLRHVILPRCDHVFVQSERMANDLFTMGVPTNRMTPIITGIDLEGVEPRTKLRQTAVVAPFRVAYLGTLVRERHLEVLVEMLAILNRRGLVTELLLIGDSAKPEDRNSIEKRASDLQVSNQVTITGFLPRRTALNLARTADVGISPFFPSKVLDVASPTKLIEYLALGLPAVANSHPDQSAVLRACRAGVCVPWGARHFARAIVWLSRRSNTELAEMGRRGREWVDANRSYSRIADDFERGCRQAALVSLER